MSSIEHECGYLIMILDRYLSERVTDDLEEHDVSLSQMSILAYIAEKDGVPVSMKEMERHFGIAQPTVAGMVKKLERRGYVELSLSPSDRRAKNAVITDRGREVVKLQREYREDLESEILAPLAPGERDLLIDMLYRISSNAGIIRKSEQK